MELLSKETIRLIGSTEKVIAKNKNGENVPEWEVVYVILLHCNILNNSYQQASKVLFTFESDKKFEQLITMATSFINNVKNY